MNKQHFLISDLKRLLKSHEFYFSFLGVAAVLFFSLEDVGISDAGVLFTYVFATDMSGMMLTYVFCAVPFAIVFCEDLEKKYIRYAVIRGNIKRYVLSKVIVIYSSSVFSMVVGTIIFILVCKTKVPWINSDIYDLNMLISGSYSNLLLNNHFFLYCILFALQLGFFAGFLSVSAAFFSLYITNRVSVLVFPVLLRQILVELSGLGIYHIHLFKAYNPFWRQGIQNLIGVFLYSLIPVFVLTFCIYKKLKTRL